MNCDLLIIGTGLVGTSLALALKSLPLSIVLVEASPIKTDLESNSDSRSLALTYASANILNAIGVWSYLESVATAIETVHVSERGHFGMTRIKASDEQVPALGYVIPAPLLGNVLNTQLLTMIEHHPNFSLCNPAKVQQLSANDQGWQVTVETVEGLKNIDARLVIAADGTDSTVRKLLNISAQIQDYQQSAIATSAVLTRNHKKVAYERFTEQGVLATLPLQDPQRCGLVWTAPNNIIDELQSLDKQEFLQRAQEVFGYRLGKFVDLGVRHSYPLKTLYADEQIRDGLVLVGNAAHTLYPLAAQGFNLGLSDVALLAQVISEAVRAKRNPGELDILQKYLEQRFKPQQRITQFTDNLVNLFSQDFLPLTVARNTGLLVLDLLPPLKNKLAKRLMGMEGKLPNLVRGVPL